MVTNNYSQTERYNMANTIWRTLGSQRFSLLAKCEPLAYGERDGKVYLLMSVGHNKGSVTRFEVAYDESKDLFELRFIRKCGGEAHVSASYNDVYGDMIRPLFERQTGMDIKMCA